MKVGPAAWTGSFLPVERLIYRLCGYVKLMKWIGRHTVLAMLVFNAAGLLTLYLLQRVQGLLPLNPADSSGAVTPDLAFNTAAAFRNNTNWQAYGGETTLSYLTQMMGLTVQNFVSAATGMAILVALIRGLARRNAHTIGNFWADLTRSTLYIFLPLSFVLALALVSQGVVQTFGAYETATMTQPFTTTNRSWTRAGNQYWMNRESRKQNPQQTTEQVLAVGPAASQIAIKQLGTNGGGFFNVNSAHPFENPTPLSNFLEVLAILLIPAALCYTFGMMVGDTRQGWALLAAMTIL